MSAIVAEDVVKRYGQTDALSGLTFEVRPGEMFGLIGPDGAGKTTTIRLLCGLIRPDRGRVRVLGLDPVGDHRRLTERIGYLSQRFSLYGDLTIDENIAFFAEVHGVRRFASRRERLLEMTQLRPFRGRLAEQLSGGMKQKLALACTLVHEPDLLLLDEPTTGVDPISRREFWKLLSEFLAQGITILMSTPYLDEAERCSRVALVHEGEVLALDEPRRLRARLPGRMLEVAGLTRGDISRLRHVPGVASAQVFGDRIHVALVGAGDDAISSFATALRATGLRGASVRPLQPSLEDVFIAQLSGEKEEVSRA